MKNAQRAAIIFSLTAALTASCVHPGSSGGPAGFARRGKQDPGLTEIIKYNDQFYRVTYKEKPFQVSPGRVSAKIKDLKVLTEQEATASTAAVREISDRLLGEAIEAAASFCKFRGEAVQDVRVDGYAPMYDLTCTDGIGTYGMPDLDIPPIPLGATGHSVEEPVTVPSTGL